MTGRGSDPLPAGVRLAVAAAVSLVAGAGAASPGAASPSGSAAGYTEMGPGPIAGAGVISGRVVPSDPPAAPGPTAIHRDREVCGDVAFDRVIEIGERGGLAGAVVALEAIPSGKAIDRRRALRLDHLGCRLLPRIQAAVVGQRLEVTNSDPILHTAHALLEGLTTVFNLTLPIQNQKIPKTLHKPGLLEIRCDAGHEWTRAWIAVFEHPYAAITDASGAFRLEDVPSGSYRVRAWHEAAGTEVLTAAVEPGGEAVLHFKRLRR